RSARERQTPSTPPCRRTLPTRTCGASSGKPLPGCCGTSNSTISTCADGSTAIRTNRHRPRGTSTAATAAGRMSSPATSCPGRTNGNEVRLMHPNGQLPAYEWAFGDVNPPVHAWAAMRVFQNDRDQAGGSGDFEFLARVFHKLLLNFTWWVNRKDPQGLNIFEGGFLGLDNIGVFDRSRP